MSTNLATILVGLGYDLSALEKGAPEAFRLVNQQTLGMSAEMKRSSREGAESLRLIDESLGIHISRPLTRILTQEFPALASGLQTVLGGAVFGALATVGVEAFDKVAERIEKARKAEEELESATRKVGETFTDAMQGYEKSDKERSLSGLDKSLFEIDFSAVEQGRKQIDALSEAMLKEAAAATEAHKWTTELLASLGDAAHAVFSSSSTLGTEQIDKQFTEFRQKFDELSKLDALHQTNESAKYVNDQLADAEKTLVAMTALKVTPAQSFLVSMGESAAEAPPTEQKGYSPEEIAHQQQFIDNLKKINELLVASNNDQSGREGEARNADYLERQQKAMEALATMQRDIGAGLGKVTPQTDPFAKLMTEITGLRQQAVNDFRAIQESAASALDVHLAQQRLEDYGRTLDQIVAKAQLDKQISDAQASLAKTPIAAAPLPAGIAQTPNIPAPTLSMAPQLADLQELTKIQTDANEAWTKAGQVLAAIETPEQKYETGMRTLGTLLTEGRITTEQFTAAQQKLQEQLAESTNKLEELLKKTGDAGAGFQAFLMQLDKSANQGGAFTFDILNKGLQGFEEQTVQALTGGKTSWTKYFEELDQMALKFMLNKGMAQLLHIPAIGNALGTLGGGTNPTTGSPLGPTPSSIPLPPGVFGSLPGVINGTNGTSTATLATAGTQLTSAATQQMSAATMLEEAAARLGTNGIGAGAIPFPGAGGGAGDTVWSGGGAAGDIADAPVPFFAEGTDDAPGGMSWVGEQGPELVNLPAGSQVTPNSAVNNLGGHTVNLHIDARGGEIGVEDKIARAISASVPQMVLRSIVEASELQRRTPR